MRTEPTPVRTTTVDRDSSPRGLAFADVGTHYGQGADWLRAVASIVAAIAAVATLTGCGISYEAWAVTYEVSVADTASPDLTGVAYAEAEGRNGPSETIALGDAKGKGSPASWSEEVTVSAQKSSYVTATPAPGGIATCRILLDGTREMDSQTAAPGQPVTCSVSTPSFD